ncbi:hypothetical protein CLF_106955 [Clonorchis sinensis]|uniref:Uncharacterized protein n=1 Tax=Clonorchis sinensis TaxID=79923 RepID=G7YQA3_CLOSI|nr:hypothetical protein CLF_106955 [Clonorchis sinensis]
MSHALNCVKVSIAVDLFSYFQVLVDHGADINQHDELLCTPMHHAARNGHTRKFKQTGVNKASPSHFGKKAVENSSVLLYLIQKTCHKISKKTAMTSRRNA